MIKQSKQIELKTIKTSVMSFRFPGIEFRSFDLQMSSALSFSVLYHRGITYNKILTTVVTQIVTKIVGTCLA